MSKYEAIEKYNVELRKLKELRQTLRNLGFSSQIINDGKLDKCLVWFDYINRTTNSFSIFVDDEGFGTQYIQVKKGSIVSEDAVSESVESLIAKISKSI